MTGSTGSTGPRGSTGATGLTGATGATGATGTVDTSNYYTKTESDGRYALASLFGDGVSPSSIAGAGITCVLGQIELTASPQVLPTNWTLADGQLVTIAANSELFQLIGTTYGGNGSTNYALPNLQAADPKGAGSAAPAYAICSTGTYP